MATKTGFRVYIGIEQYTYDSKKGTNSKMVVNGNVLETVAEERVEGSAVHGDWTLNGHVATLKEADTIVAKIVHIKPPFTGYPCSCMDTRTIPQRLTGSPIRSPRKGRVRK